MKLNEIKRVAGPRKEEFIYKKFDALEPEGVYVEPFDVKVVYEVDPASSSDHPYGEGTATEHHSGSLHIVSLEINEPVKFVNDDNGEELQTFKAGTNLEKMPGYTETVKRFFQQEAEERFSE